MRGLKNNLNKYTMNINQEIEKEEMKVQNLVKDWHSQKLVSFIDDLIKQDRAEQLILSGVSKSVVCGDCDGYGYTVDENGRRKEHCNECEGWG